MMMNWDVMLARANELACQDKYKVVLPPEEFEDAWCGLLATAPIGPSILSFLEHSGIREWFTLCGVRFERSLEGYDDHVLCLDAAGMI